VLHDQCTGHHAAVYIFFIVTVHKAVINLLLLYFLVDALWWGYFVTANEYTYIMAESKVLVYEVLFI